jgi:hypothetical protein
MRLTAIDRYTATAADGYTAMADVIEVDAKPDDTNPTRGTIAVPITVIDADDTIVLETVCRGWGTNGGQDELYVNELNIDSIAGPLTVLVAPSRALINCLQPAEAHAGGDVGPGTYDAHIGHMHHVTIQDDATIRLVLAGDYTGWYGVYRSEDGISAKGVVTRLVVDNPSNFVTPTLTWTVEGLSGIKWESGAPQFSGKSTLLVELWSDGGNNLLGWFREVS